MELRSGRGIQKRQKRFVPGPSDSDTIRDMGVNLMRLYDWEPRNKHQSFLDACWDSISVLAPVSNYSP